MSLLILPFSFLNNFNIQKLKREISPLIGIYSYDTFREVFKMISAVYYKGDENNLDDEDWEFVSFISQKKNSISRVYFIVDKFFLGLEKQKHKEETSYLGEESEYVAFFTQALKVFCKYLTAELVIEYI